MYVSQFKIDKKKFKTSKSEFKIGKQFWILINHPLIIGDGWKGYFCDEKRIRKLLNPFFRLLCCSHSVEGLILSHNKMPTTIFPIYYRCGLRKRKRENDSIIFSLSCFAIWQICKWKNQFTTFPLLIISYPLFHSFTF